MKRTLLIIIGFLSVALGAIGALLPVVPTTPFLLLAAFCFAQSSERWHQWLMNNRFAGPMVRDWHARRCIRLETKALALSGMVIAAAVTVTFLLQEPGHRIAALALMSIGALVVLLLPTCPRT